MKKILGLAVVLLTAAASQAWAQDYPNKPVHVIISFTPGSSTDIVGRIVMNKVSEIWGQPVVPDNRAGAGGSIGSAAVGQGAPHGHPRLPKSTPLQVHPGMPAKPPSRTLMG